MSESNNKQEAIVKEGWLQFSTGVFTTKKRYFVLDSAKKVLAVSDKKEYSRSSKECIDLEVPEKVILESDHGKKLQVKWTTLIWKLQAESKDEMDQWMSAIQNTLWDINQERNQKWLSMEKEKEEKWKLEQMKIALEKEKEAERKRKVEENKKLVQKEREIESQKDMEEQAKRDAASVKAANKAAESNKKLTKYVVVSGNSNNSSTSSKKKVKAEEVNSSVNVEVEGDKSKSRAKASRKDDADDDVDNLMHKKKTAVNAEGNESDDENNDQHDASTGVAVVRDKLAESDEDDDKKEKGGKKKIQGISQKKTLESVAKQNKQKEEDEADEDDEDDDSGKERDKKPEKEKNKTVAEYEKEANTSEEEVDPDSVAMPTSVKQAFDQIDKYLTNEVIVERCMKYLRQQEEEDADYVMKIIVERDYLQILVELLSVYYKNVKYLKFLLPKIVKLTQDDENKIHLLRMSNGLVVISKIYSLDEEMGVSLYKDLISLLAAMIKKRNDYTTDFTTKKTKLFAPIVETSELIIPRSLDYTLSFMDFVAGLAAFEGTIPSIIAAGTSDQMLIALQRYCKDNAQVIRNFFNYMAFMPPEELTAMSKKFSKMEDVMSYLFLDAMKKFDNDTTIMNMCALTFKKLGKHPDCFKKLISLWSQNEEDATVTLNFTMILQYLICKPEDRTVEMIKILAKTNLMIISAKILKFHARLGWIVKNIACFVRDMLLLRGDAECRSQIFQDFVSAKGLESIVPMLTYFKNSEDMVSVFIKIIDEYVNESKEYVPLLMKNTGFIGIILQFIETNRQLFELQSVGVDVLLKTIDAVDFDAEDADEATKDAKKDLIAFTLKVLQDLKDPNLCGQAFDILSRMNQPEKYIAVELTSTECKSLLENVNKNLLTDNEDYLTAMFTCMGRLARSNKNRQSFAQQGVIETLKKVYKAAPAKVKSPAVQNEVKMLGLTTS